MALFHPVPPLEPLPSPPSPCSPFLPAMPLEPSSPLQLDTSLPARLATKCARRMPLFDILPLFKSARRKKKTIKTCLNTAPTRWSFLCTLSFFQPASWLPASWVPTIRSTTYQILLFVLFISLLPDNDHIAFSQTLDSNYLNNLSSCPYPTLRHNGTHKPQWDT